MVAAKVRKAIWICRSPLVPLDTAWPRLKALD
jgi:hypothetical protein